MMLMHPLFPEEGITQIPLMFSVNQAPKGSPDFESGMTYVTTYAKFADKAQALLDILPGYIAYRFGQEVAESWFHAVSLAQHEDITFNTYDNGE